MAQTKPKGRNETEHCGKFTAEANGTNEAEENKWRSESLCDSITNLTVGL